MVQGSRSRRIVRFSALAICALASMTAVAGCPLETPFPSFTGPPPTISSSSVSPTTVVAGQPITGTVTASHPNGINTIALQVFGPDGETLRHSDPTQCSSDQSFMAVPQTAPGVASEVTANRAMPAFASNGFWTMTITVSAGRGGGAASVTVPFEVIGGTDDTEPPVITTLTGPPPTIAPGASFDLAFQIDDTNLAIDQTPSTFWFGALHTDDLFICVSDTPTQVSPTEADITVTCTVGATEPPATYTAEFFSTDLLGLRTVVPLSVQVT